MANDSGIANRNGAAPDAQTVRPYYKAVGNEEAIDCPSRQSGKI